MTQRDGLCALFECSLSNVTEAMVALQVPHAPAGGLCTSFMCLDNALTWMSFVLLLIRWTNNLLHHMATDLYHHWKCAYAGGDQMVRLINCHKNTYVGVWPQCAVACCFSDCVLVNDFSQLPQSYLRRLIWTDLEAIYRTLKQYIVHCLKFVIH